MSYVIDNIPDNSGGTWGSAGPNPAAAWQFAQTFIVSGSARVLESATWEIYNDGTGTGSFTFKVYAISGTAGSNATPTGAAIATTNSRVWNTVSGGWQMVNLPFTTNPSLPVGNYMVVIDSTAGSGGNPFTRYGPAIAGRNYAEKYGAGAWSPYSSDVFVASIYGQDTTSTKTQTGVSRIQSSFFPTQTGQSRITITQPYDQSGVARITAASIRPQIGAARITATTSYPQTGIARIALITSKTVTGKANIRSTMMQSQQGVARINENLQPVVGYSLQMYYGGLGYAMVPGIYYYQMFIANRVIVGTARIAKDSIQDQIGVARIAVVNTRSQVGVSSILRITARDQFGRSRITFIAQRAQQGRARITSIAKREQAGVSCIVARYLGPKPRIDVVRKIIVPERVISKPRPIDIVNDKPKGVN